ncbi:SDR family oxidoreductase [Ascidiaceihabitans sp.]|uniref:SDR family NAD(P)-dependent oxidoreductase n=1 Tax=Ascidiaceihabitans sp. TaxID=1872644 RepID=UPI00329A6EE6
MTPWTLITGASSGLGVEFAHIAAKAGRNLILTARSEDKLTALAEDLRRFGGDVVVLPADLSDLDAVQALWEDASADRHIDVLVNNAGLGRNGTFGDGGDWARELASMQVNMTALTYLMKAAIPHMEAAGGGRILNVASLAGFMPGPNMAVYSASKAYVLSLSEAVAEELRNSSVTVTALCPGATQTEFFDNAKMDGVRMLKTGMIAKAFDVAELGWLESRIGKRIVVPGLMNKVFGFMPRIAPRFVVSRLAHYLIGKG